MTEDTQETTVSDGSPDLYRIRDSATGEDFAVRLGTNEQLTRLQADLQAQHDGFLRRAFEEFRRAANALSGANLVSYELDRRANEAIGKVTQ